MLRTQIERCDNLDGLSVHFGLGGGLGAGFAHNALSDFKTEFGQKKSVQAYTMFTEDSSAMQAFNFIIGLNEIMEQANNIIFISI